MSLVEKYTHNQRKKDERKLKTLMDDTTFGEGQGGMPTDFISLIFIVTKYVLRSKRK